MSFDHFHQNALFQCTYLSTKQFRQYCVFTFNIMDLNTCFQQLLQYTYLYQIVSKEQFFIFRRKLQLGFYQIDLFVSCFLKASFWGLFKTNFYGCFRKLFLFTKFKFSKFREKVFLTVLRSMCLEFCASNYLPKLSMMAYFKTSKH